MSTLDDVVNHTAHYDALWHFLVQIAQGVAHLHSRRILHRDPKPANVFLTSEGSVRIGDLGLGRLLGPHSDFADTAVGTPIYFSPELCDLVARCRPPVQSIPRRARG